MLSVDKSVKVSASQQFRVCDKHIFYFYRHFWAAVKASYK